MEVPGLWEAFGTALAINTARAVGEGDGDTVCETLGPVIVAVPLGLGKVGLIGLLVWFYFHLTKDRPWLVAKDQLR